MKVIVFPHDLEMGGSQLGALQLAGQLRALGVESIVFGRAGALSARINELGLEFVEAPAPGRRPSLRVARSLRQLVRERGADIVHGYEWPPTLEAVLATRSLNASPVSTVMSMAVAPFIPTWVPLVVGTAQIAAAERAFGRPSVHFMEPPIDLSTDVRPPEAEVAAFRVEHGLDDMPTVVIVCRLVKELKLEGILSAIQVAGDLTDSHPWRLLIVGDGAERPVVQRAADAVNARTGRRTVVLTGKLDDPRVAYAAADLSIGMGSSALRALAFSLPLIVQGEEGYFTALSSETASEFGWKGWFGHGDGPDHGPAALTAALVPLLADADLRAERGRFGRQVAENASLARAAKLQLAMYEQVIASKRRQHSQAGANLASAARLGGYYTGRLASRLRGSVPVDDFNAVRLASPTQTTKRLLREPVDEAVVYFAGSRWDDIPGTDVQVTTELAKHWREVVWVDPPRVWRPSERLRPVRSNQVAANITRLSVLVPPGFTRPGVRGLATRGYVAAARNHLQRSRVQASVVIVASWQPVLPHVLGHARRVLYATDDFVAASSLWGISESYLHRAREANLRHADLVVAVTDTLADQLRRGADRPVVLPNGCDPHAFPESPNPVAGIRLTHPIAGVLGQMNERTDLELLEAVRSSGVNVLVVGPKVYGDPGLAAIFDDFIKRPGVQWVGRVPRETLPGILTHMDVGLTAYADTPFNRNSFPLKTMDYLASGLPVVTTSATGGANAFDINVVRVASDPADYVHAVHDVLRARPDPADCRAEAEANSWTRRIELLNSLLRRTT